MWVLVSSFHPSIRPSVCLSFLSVVAWHQIQHTAQVCSILHPSASQFQSIGMSHRAQHSVLFWCIVLDPFSVAVLREERALLILEPCSQPSSGVGVGTQTRNQEAGTDLGNLRGSSLLLTYLWLAQPAFLHHLAVALMNTVLDPPISVLREEIAPQTYADVIWWSHFDGSFFTGSSFCGCHSTRQHRYCFSEWFLELYHWPSLTTF